MLPNTQVRVAEHDTPNARLRCLWIARYVPYPLDAGAKVYSAGISNSLANANVEVHAIGFGDDAAVPATTPVKWIGLERARKKNILALFSRMPIAAALDATPKYRELLQRYLREHWDVIVFDGYGSGWALDTVLRCSAPQTLLVHVSHNHEGALWQMMGQNGPLTLQRLASQQNAIKVSRLERRLVANAHILTTITDEDGVALSAPGSAHTITLTPGYSGATIRSRQITEATPRRVLLMGSFQWAIKRENLRLFAEAADARFRRAGITVDIVGDVPSDLRDSLRRFTSLEFHGFLNDPSAILANVRIGVVPEVIGGGFKLKLLDYIFGRIPIAALSNACAGMSAALLDAMIVRSDLDTLIDAIVASIDDVSGLNRMQRRAIELGDTQFRWEDRGIALRQAIDHCRAQSTSYLFADARTS